LKPFKILGVSLIIIAITIMVMGTTFTEQHILDAKDVTMYSSYTDGSNTTSPLYNSNSSIQTFIYKYIQNKQIVYGSSATINNVNTPPNLWWLVLLSGFLLAEGILITWNKKITDDLFISNSLVEVKATLFVVSFLAMTLSFYLLQCIVNLMIPFSILQALGWVLVVIGMIIVVGIVLYCLMIGWDIFDIIGDVFEAVCKFLFGWFIKLNKWMIKKSAEEDKRGNRHKKSRR